MSLRDDVANQSPLDSIGLDHDESALTLLHVEGPQGAVGRAKDSCAAAKNARCGAISMYRKMELLLTAQGPMSERGKSITPRTKPWW